MLEHGGRLRQAALRYGIAEADWLDLSSGLAPWPFAIGHIPERAWARLPETDDGLEQAACSYYGAPHVLPVPGSQCAIQLLPRLRRSGKVGVLSPCYAEHAEAWRRNGHIVREIMEQEVDFYLDKLDVLVVVNPNNPTGLSLSPERLLDWHARLVQRGGWLVVDEAFMDNTPTMSLAPQSQRTGLIVLRSFGKFFGLAGVRLGFVIAAPGILARLRELLGDWPVSTHAILWGSAAYADREWIAATRIALVERARALDAVLARHGLVAQGACPLFRMVDTPAASDLFRRLAAAGILVRPFADAPERLRFGVPAAEAELERLDKALRHG